MYLIFLSNIVVTYLHVLGKLFIFVQRNFTLIYSGIPISRTSRGNKLVREIGEFEKSGVKLQCLTEEKERLLVRVIWRFEKMRV